MGLYTTPDPWRDEDYWPRRGEAPSSARAVVRKLKTRPGRGGIRLSYAEADLVLRLIAAGAQALARERLRREADDDLGARSLDRLGAGRKRGVERLIG